VALVPAVLDVGLRAAAAKGAVLIVEGVGGALVEVAEGLMVAELPRRWDLPVLVVAANRLGVLSHTLLTVEVLQARGARVLGVVLNTLRAGAPTLAEATNEDELRRLLPRSVPLLATVAWVSDEDRGAPRSLALAVDELASALCGRKRGP
jgi:dethiobiotin synthetase